MELRPKWTEEENEEAQRRISDKADRLYLTINTHTCPIKLCNRMSADDTRSEVVLLSASARSRMGSIRRLLRKKKKKKEKQEDSNSYRSPLS